MSSTNSASEASSTKSACEGTVAPSSTDGIMEVYEYNFVSEIKKMSRLLEQYNFVGMDTEFPGVVYSIQNYSQDFYYQSIKLNVDSLKLIQVGITLSNSKGEKPEGIHTWQFNLRFNYEKEPFNASSCELLTSCGVNFEKMSRKGIPYDLFGEYLTISGLALNPDLTWICFHGSYDFAYLLKSLTNSPLPETEQEFTELLSLYFPQIYDIKIMIKSNQNETFKQGSWGLNKLAQYLEVYRKGMTHQAGSDSILTLDVFFTLLRKGYFHSEIIPSFKLINANYQAELSSLKNIIFGIGLGADEEETLSYTNIGIFKGFDYYEYPTKAINMNNNLSNYYSYAQMGKLI